MPRNAQQNYANHTRFDPPFHFFLMPVAVVSFVIACWNAVRHPSFLSVWFIVVAIASVVAVFKIRLYALKVQDRVIRLEERLRLAMLAPDELRTRIGELSQAQLIALRFASDQEALELVEKALSSNMPASEIKKAIANWRPDHCRV